MNLLGLFVWMAAVHAPSLGGPSPGLPNQLPEFTEDRHNDWTVGLGEEVRIRLRVDSNGYFHISVCDDKSCTNFLMGGAENRTIGFAACSSPTADRCSSYNIRSYTGPEKFHPGDTYVLVVERRPAAMAVWLDGMPEDAAVIPLAAKSHDTLKISSSAGSWEFLPDVTRFSILSPVILPSPARICVDIEFSMSQPKLDLEFSVIVNGFNRIIGKIPLSSAQLETWQSTRHVIPNPAEPEGTEWQLNITGPGGIRVRKISPCTDGEPGMTLLFQQAWQPPCVNGGLPTPGAESCACPPGFSGTSCEISCGPGRYGSGCSERCDSGGCRQRVQCVAGLGCLCAAGHQGERCDTPCRAGTYGADCLQRCGHCEGGAACDPYSGHCRQGCAHGYSGNNCKDELTRLSRSPEVMPSSSTELRGTIRVSPEDTVGKGEILFVRFDYREAASGDWVNLTTERFSFNEDISFAIDALHPGTEYDIRAVLLDSRMAAFQPEVTPYTRVRTGSLLPDAVRDLVAYRWNLSSVGLSWLRPALPSGPLVRYELSVTGPAIRMQRPIRVRVPAESACAAWPQRVCHLLHGLQPNTNYTVTVTAVNAHSDMPGLPSTTSALTRTGCTANAPVNLQVVPSQSNSTAITVQWGLPPVLGADLDFFVFHVSEVGAGSRMSDVKQQGVSEEKPLYQYTFTGLHADSEYHVVVRLGAKGTPAELFANTTAPHFSDNDNPTTPLIV